MSDRLRIAMIAAERVPLAKVGGLGDVVGALSHVLAERGHEVTGFLPAYRGLSMPAGAKRARALDPFPVPLGPTVETASVDRVTFADSRAEVLLVDHRGRQGFFDRDGVYSDPVTGEDYADNGERFAFFCRAVTESLKRLGRRPDILHLHDHQTAMAAAIVRLLHADDPFFQRSGILFTVHNIGYQGQYPPELLERAGIPRDQFRPGSPFEFFGKLNSMKVGLLYADLINTVSPRYAQEIQTSAEYGFGLEGILRERAGDLWGILNGVDYAVWNPETDPWIAARYSARDPGGKQACKAALAEAAGWPRDSEWPIVGMITRLADQKGLDLVEQAVADLLSLELRLFVLGTGAHRYQELLEGLGREHPDRVHAVLGFDEPLSHRIEAGADLFLMPSRYEPCGLNQMMSLRYGTIPIVRATGGLADTVPDFDPASREGMGFVFQDYDAAAMTAAIKRALALYRQPRVWQQILANAMAQDFSWEASACRYEDAYREVRARVEKRRFRSWAEGVARG